MWLDPGVARSIIAVATGSNAPKRTSQALTEREEAVLKGVFGGLANKEIGLASS